MVISYCKSLIYNRAVSISCLCLPLNEISLTDDDSLIQSKNDRCRIDIIMTTPYSLMLSRLSLKMQALYIVRHVPLLAVNDIIVLLISLFLLHASLVAPYYFCGCSFDFSITVFGLHFIFQGLNR